MSDGLEDVVAASTVLSEVDGAAGRLILRGHALEDIAGHADFAEAARLMFDGFFPDLPAGEAFARALGQSRVEVFSEVAALDSTLISRTPTEALRALMARLPDGDDLATALRFLAAPAVFTPAIVRAQRGLAAIAPDASLSHTQDILRMMHSDGPTTTQAAALDAYLVTVCDHGLNASTFAARVVASTRAGLGSAVLAGLSALKGPLHGGAPGPVIDMLDEIGDASHAKAWLEAALQRGDRLMGFGHRIYRVRDPRADALKRAIRKLDASAGRLAYAEAVEAAALAILRERKPNRSLQTNVEFYTALLLEALAFPPDTFTCVFAMGRTIGWLAHAREQIAGGRLVRPQSIYIGPMPQQAA
ncbi:MULTISPECIES: citrate synthase/methylcitrate synthase [unclassified Beijerinckia]|uniref:citrate synthase/methylcitrate synthase n=1 Tax=unclassified Beijerinckia TaxID=2638183 RepID=UPI000B855097|nr:MULTISPECIES: citrate synthase/methylcitrate synthase [unclassified Beijerinckia]